MLQQDEQLIMNASAQNVTGWCVIFKFVYPFLVFFFRQAFFVMHWSKKMPQQLQTLRVANGKKSTC